VSDTVAVATALAAHIPRYISAEVGGRPLDALTGTPLRREAAVLFCDISGFTPLSEALGAHGKEGTETLTVLLNDYFDLLIGVLESWGGDVVKFGGDAVTVLFEPGAGESLPEVYGRACACALSVFKTLGGTRPAPTPWGDFTLSLKIGASAGSLLAGVVGDPHQRLEHVLAGQALDRMAEAEHHARPGWTVVDTMLPWALCPGLRLEPLGGGFARLLEMEGRPVPRGRLAPPPPEPSRLRPFLLPAVWGQVEAGTAALLSEHRRVVPVFVAFPGFDYSDDASLARLDTYFRRVAQLLVGYGGSFNRMDMGDKGSKFLCFFGAPESYENNEERAAAFALALRGLERELPWLGAQRVGLSTGTAYCGVMGSPGRREYTVMGDTVNVAARLMAAAGDAGVLATEEVRQATADKFRWGAYRELAVKGKTEPLKVSTPVSFQRRTRPRAVQSAIGFVGRGSELALLHGALKRAARAGGAAPLLLTGESGAGKTALLETFLARAATVGTATALGACPPVAAAPFQPWAQAFGALLAGEIKGRDALEARWLELLPDQREFLGLGLDFLGYATELSSQARSLGPQERWDKVVDLLARTLAALAGKRPVVLALDDLHDADIGSLRLLAELPPRSARGVLFLGAARPGFAPPLRCRELPLRGLGPEEVEAFARAFLRAERVPPPLLELLAGRCAGSPLFLLEVLQHLVEAGALARDREGRLLWESERAGSLPGSVEGLLLARMDRLPLEMRNTLKVASCLGPNFDLDLLHAVFEPATEPALLRERLAATESLGLRAGEGEHARTYTFSHASLREAAYGSVLLSNRRAIHLAAAQALEARGAGVSPALPAFHFGAAGAWDRAVPYGLAAATAFRDRYDFATALAQYTEVESWAERAGTPLAPGDRLHIAECAITCAENGRALELLGAVQADPALTPAERLRSDHLLLRLLEGSGEYEECVGQAGRLEEEARAAGDPAVLLEAARYRISSLFRLGRLPEAERALEEALAEASSASGESVGPLKILEAALRFQRGEFPASVACYDAARSWAEARGHYPTLLQAHLGLANPLRELGRVKESIACAQRALEIAELLGSRMNILGAATALATGLNWSGQSSQALETLERARAYLDEAQHPYAACVFWNQLGVTQYFLKDYARALRHYRKCRSLARKNLVPQWIAHATYNIADGMKALGNRPRSLAEYRKAVLAFRRIEDVPYFLQAVREMAELEREEGGTGLERLRHWTSGLLRRWGKPELLAQVFPEQ